jgi:DNA modification methylase
MEYKMTNPPEWINCCVKLGDLKPWAENPRFSTKAQAERIVASLKQFGQPLTISIGPNNEVYDGHQRLSAWLTLHGPDFEVDARRASYALSDEQRRGLVLALSPLGAFGSFDWEKLSGWQPAELKAWGADNETLKGWKDDVSNLGKFIESEKTEADAEAQIDRADELLEKWGVTPGSLWQIGEHRLLCGDCTSIENAALLFGDKRAQLGVTSPPYAVGKEYEVDVTFAEHLKLLESVADRALEIIEPGGFFFVNFGEIAAQSHAGPLTGSKRQCIYLISKDYWRIFHEERLMDLYAQRIWYKPFNRLQQPFWSYKTSIPHYQEWEHIWTWRLPGGDSDSVHNWDISVHAVWDTRNESTDDKPLTRHSAAFPVCLPERAIKAHSDKGDLIWEPFTGSGTTMLVCQNNERICFGTELDPAYCAVTLERMNTAFPGLPIERIGN